MSTITVPDAMSAPEVNAPRAGLLRRLYDAMIEARHREAQHRIAVHVQSLSDDALRDLGFTETEIRSVRAGGSVGNLLAKRARRHA